MHSRPCSGAKLAGRQIGAAALAGGTLQHLRALRRMKSDRGRSSVIVSAARKHLVIASAARQSTAVRPQRWIAALRPQ